MTQTYQLRSKRITYFYNPGFFYRRPDVYKPSIQSKEPPYAVYVGDNIRVETTEESAIAGMPQTVIRWECERVLDLLKKIVKEAREIFK